MKTQKYQQNYQIAITTFLTTAGIFTSNNLPGLAQLTPDNTLGSEKSIVHRIDNFKDIIQGGATRGANLFHSFEKFNVGANKSVYFANPTGIENILTRVTGNNISQILGTLGVNGNANLFLINPHGIYFGKDAALNIQGSFTATTTDAIKLGENGLFSAKEPAKSNLLTVQPEALFINNIKNQQAKIENVGNLTASKNLTFHAGTINTSGKLKATENLTLKAVGDITTGDITAAKITLNSMNGTINTTNGLLDTSSKSAAGDITLEAARDIRLGKTLAISENSGGGNIKIISGNSISIEGLVNSGTHICTQKQTCNNTSPIGGDIYLKSPLITANNNSVLVNIQGRGQGGNLIIETDILNVFGEIKAVLGTTTQGSGNGGDLTVKAKEIYITNGGVLESSTNGAGSAGNVDLLTNKLFIQDIRNNPLLPTGITSVSQVTIENIIRDRITNFELTNNDFNLGRGGNININALESIEIIGNIPIANSLENLELLTSFLNISAGITTGTLSNGEAGNLTINTKNLITRNGAGISTAAISPRFIPNIYADFISFTVNNEFSSLPQEQQLFLRSIGINPATITNKIYSELFKFSNGGKAGNLTVKADEIRLIGAGGLTTGTMTSSNAANMTIQAKKIELQNGSLIAGTTLGIGDAGSLDITTEQLSISKGSKILTGTNNLGFGGNININASDFVEIISISSDGKTSSSILALADDNARGKAGTITLDTPKLIIKDGAGIGVNSEGLGEGGNISIVADTLTLDNQGFISAATASTQGGNIDLNLQDFLLLRNNSVITATAGTAGARGDGGNITIQAPFIIAFPSENSDITANAYQGKGGQVNITANAIFGLKEQPSDTNKSDITASSQFGLDGEVQINTPDVDPTSGLIELPGNLVVAESLIGKDICSPEQRAKKSSFIIIGRGGFPAEADDLITNSPGMVEWANSSQNQETTPVVSNRSAVNQEEENIQNPVIQNAQGWITTADGRVFLTAESPEITPQNPGLIHPHCDAQRN